MSLDKTFDDLQLYNPIYYEQEQRWKAAKSVARMTSSTEDCKEMLEALGLLHDLHQLRRSCGQKRPDSTY